MDIRIKTMDREYVKHTNGCYMTRTVERSTYDDSYRIHTLFVSGRVPLLSSTLDHSNSHVTVRGARSRRTPPSIKEHVQHAVVADFLAKKASFRPRG